MKISDVYHSIEDISKYHIDHIVKQTASSVLELLKKCSDDFMHLLTNTTTVWLQPNQVIPERHGTLESCISSKEKIKNLKKEVFGDIIQFLENFKTQIQKANFYSKIWLLPQTIYELPSNNDYGTRIDVQAPAKNAANVQIQVDSTSIASVVISDQLSGRKEDYRVAEVVNYVLRHFTCAVKHAKKYGEAIVISIAPIGNLNEIVKNLKKKK